MTEDELQELMLELDTDLTNIITKYCEKGLSPHNITRDLLVCALRMHIMCYQSDRWTEEQIEKALKLTFKLARLQHDKWTEEMRNNSSVH